MASESPKPAETQPGKQAKILPGDESQQHSEAENVSTSDGTHSLRRLGEERPLHRFL